MQTCLALALVAPSLALVASSLALAPAPADDLAFLRSLEGHWSGAREIVAPGAGTRVESSVELEVRVAPGGGHVLWEYAFAGEDERSHALEVTTVEPETQRFLVDAFVGADHRRTSYAALERSTYEDLAYTVVWLGESVEAGRPVELRHVRSRRSAQLVMTTEARALDDKEAEWETRSELHLLRLPPMAAALAGRWRLEARAEPGAEPGAEPTVHALVLQPNDEGGLAGTLDGVALTDGRTYVGADGVRFAFAAGGARWAGTLTGARLEGTAHDKDALRAWSAQRGAAAK